MRHRAGSVRMERLGYTSRPEKVNIGFHIVSKGLFFEGKNTLGPQSFLGETMLSSQYIMLVLSQDPELLSLLSLILSAPDNTGHTSTRFPFRPAI